MPLDLYSLYLRLPVFALVVSRLGGMLMFQPLLGALSIPMNVRLLLVLGLAVLVTPLVPLPATAPDTPLGLTLAIGTELLIGGLLGVVAAACFAGIQLGALLIAQESGLAYGQVVDPTTDDDETVVGVFYLQFAAVVYLVIGGHRALLTACLDTFRTLPLLCGGDAATGGAVALLTRTMALGGELALRVALPVLLTLFLVNAALGFISRTMPQLNILAVGFSIKGLIAFLVMAAALPATAAAFVDALQDVHRWISAWLALPG